jgi:hypothetical protein
MSSCTAQDVSALLTYWLGELDDAAESQIEEHLFACAACSARLRDIVQLRDGIRQQLLNGTLSSVLSETFIQRLQAAGMRVREYHLQPGGSVYCTVTPQDDLVVAHLQASLRNVRRLDLVFEDVAGGIQRRAHDVPFDPAAGQVTFMPNVTELRTLGVVTQRAQLIAVDDARERVIASYTFNHSPA